MQFSSVVSQVIYHEVRSVCSDKTFFQKHLSTKVTCLISDALSGRICLLQDKNAILDQYYAFTDPIRICVQSWTAIDSIFRFCCRRIVFHRPRHAWNAFSANSEENQTQSYAKEQTPIQIPKGYILAECFVGQKRSSFFHVVASRSVKHRLLYSTDHDSNVVNSVVDDTIQLHMNYESGNDGDLDTDGGSDDDEDCFR